MLWFLIAIVSAIIVYCVHRERAKADGRAVENAMGTLVLGGLAALVFNVVFSTAGVPKYTAFDADIDGTIQTKVVNSEAVFAFKAKGQEFSIPTDEVVIKVGDKPHYNVIKDDRTSKWITLFNTRDQRTTRTLTIPAS